MRSIKRKCLLLSLLVAALCIAIAPARARQQGEGPALGLSHKKEAALRAVKTGTKAGAQDARSALVRLLEDEWEWSMRENPTWASVLGDRRYNDRWQDASLRAIEARQQHRLETLRRIQSIDRAQLPAADQLNYDLFRKDLESEIAEFKFRIYLLPVNQRGGIQTADELTELLRFQSVKDYEDWLARLRALPRYVEQTTALMVGSSRVDLQACKLEYSIVSPK